MEKQLYFVSGLPRTGSTLMMNVLALNPAHFVTPTSGLIHLMRSVMRTWPECQEFQAQGLEMRGQWHCRDGVAPSFAPLLGKGVLVLEKGWVPQ